MVAHNRITMPTGSRYGRLTVVGDPVKNGSGKLIYRCRCDCGNEIAVEGYSLRSGNTQSCGCLQRERTSRANKTHGLCRTRLYREYRGMMSRCYNPKNPAFPNYGGRKIAVCDNWRGHVAKFVEWAIGAGYQDDLTIERVDVNGNYCPDNCTWIPRGDQAKNRRMCITVEVDGKEMCLADAARHFSLVSPLLAQERVRELHWAPLKAVTTPPRGPKVVRALGQQHTYKEWSEITGVPIDVLQLRMSRPDKWTADRAFSTPYRPTKRRNNGSKAEET